MHIKPTQISLYDHLASRRDEFIHAWGLWRNAQCLDDSHKEIVDDAYAEYIRTLDNLMEAVLPF